MAKESIQVEIREAGLKTWAPYFALAVSLVVVGISIWQGFETRQHNRKMVMPQIITFTTNDPFNTDWGIFLQNEGLGPAFIDFHKVTLDGKEMTGFEIIDQLIQEGFINSRDYAVTRLFDEGLVLKAGAKTPVLIFDSQKLNTEKAHMFLDLINERINVEYIWCSVYDECEAGCSSVSCEKPNDPKDWIRRIRERGEG